MSTCFFRVQAVTWSGTASGNWNDGTKWVGGAVPTGAGTNATFGAGAGGVVTVNAPITVGSISITAGSGNGNEWTINSSGGNSLTLDNGGSAATISITGGNKSATSENQVISANVVLNSDLSITVASGANGLTISGSISGAGKNVIVAANNLSGAVVFSGANTYSGTTRISAGTLTLGNLSALGGSTLDLNASDSGSISFGSLTSATFGGLQGSRNLSLQNASSAAVTLSVGNNGNDTAYSGILSGSGNLAKVGTGSLTVSGSSTYSGTTTVKEGTLIAGANAPSGSAGAFGNATSSVLVGDTTGSGAASLLAASGVTISRNITVQSGSSGTATLGGSSSGNSTFATNVVLNKSANLTAATGGQSTFSGTISGSGGINKVGAGTVVLNHANTYTGGTTLTQGTLKLGVNDALGTGGLTFAGGILNANNTTDSTIGLLSLTANSTLALVNDATHGTLTFAGVSGTAIGTLTITGWAGSQGGAGTDDRILFASLGVVPDSTFLSHIIFDLGNGNLVYADMNGTELVAGLTPVPEPTEWALIIFAVGAIFYKFVLPRLRRQPTLVPAK